MRTKRWSAPSGNRGRVSLHTGLRVTSQVDNRKGVICKVVEDEHMPMDENGNVADVIVYYGSRVKRLNLGSVYEHFMNATRRDLTHRLRQQAGLHPKLTPTSHQLLALRDQPELVESIWDQLMRFYSIGLPLQYEMLVNDPDHHRHVYSVLKDGLYLYSPPDNPVDDLQVCRELMSSEFCPHYGPVTYTDNAGRKVTTERPILIGSLYMLLLEKIAEDWSGVASVKTNHFGVASKLNNYDKQTSPGRQQSVRGLGESETRSYICTVGPEATTELLDQANNPDAHRVVTEAILKARYPTNIDRVVDRTKVPFGGSRPVGFVEHMLACRGIRFVYKPDTDKSDDGGLL